MRSLLRSWLVVVLAPFLLMTARADQEPMVLKVLGRSDVKDYQVQLNEQEWRLLRQKGSLVLGTSAPDFPPLGISVSGRDYEGLTADYAQLIAQLLHTPVVVHRYPSRTEALTALKEGRVDMVGGANGYEAQDAALLMSSAYADDQPVLVTREGEAPVLSDDLAGMKVAMLDNYLPPKAVEDYYPKADIRLYTSALSALGAVAFGQADVYLGDAITSNYLISKNYLNNVQLADFSRMEVQPFAFAFAPHNAALVQVVDKALAAIPTNERMAILRRWGAGGTSVLGKQKLDLSRNEYAWLKKHPRIKVAINENFLPFTFLDEHGRFRGISADVLAKISLRTGLKFDVVHLDSVNDLVSQVATGKADMLAAFTPSSEREGELRFTRPYLTVPFVLVTPAGDGAPRILDEMAGKRLAVISGNLLQQYVHETFPEVRTVTAESSLDAMEMVAQGRADGAINSLVSARYLISRQYRDRLQIGSTVGTEPARVAFATDRGALELYSILEKGLLSISPEEMDELSDNWRGELLTDDSYWMRHRSAIIQGFVFASVLLLLAIAWIAYLRRQVRRRELAELALNDQMEFMRVLIDGTPNPIYVRDRQGRLVICNAGYLQVFNVERDTVIGRTLIDGGLGGIGEAADYHRDYLEAMEKGTSQAHDRPLTMPDGRVLTIYHWILPYRGHDGEVAGMIAGWIDVSERQHLLAQLQSAKQSADDANRAKTIFLATMSHEIRTPMNAVIGMLEMALKKADQGVMDRFAIEVASGAARGLLDLIGDILDIARIESGRLSLTPERANLRELLESVVRVFDGVARQKHLRLVLELDAGTYCDVLIDPMRFKQVVSNLLSNAIKFTESGQVRLSVRVNGSAEHERLGITLEVEDTGCGISEADQRRLFAPFSQANSNNQSLHGGSGLGLVISRTLCEMMGGELQLHSVVGRGTQVVVQLNLTVMAPLTEVAPPALEVQAPGRPLNILVIDDYPANRLLLIQQLSYLGHRVEDAEDGAHGLRSWLSRPFDVVITDCNMPIMNGYELARAIRDDERSRELAPCLILGFTANAQAEEKDRCLAAGMDDCLFKPISLKHLSARLASVAPQLPQLPPLEEQPPSRRDDAPDSIEMTSLRQLTRGDAASISRLLNDLMLSNDKDMARLMLLFSQHDLPGLADLAHRVKGGARIIHAEELIRCCEALEVACDSPDAATLPEAVDLLLGAMERLKERLEPHL
ncbi:transporter substrate-binding domain-containing protein [Pseudomonas lurida]|uniref:transporter substrate-binding domain-containing protein n=1 Tax=Pseudomonas TaxID=286 RepID=UPI0015E2E8D4|nr:MULTISPECIES: transporter substrate-binding domain-containing protein [Pseudomonas]MBA1293240.1 transporter substrate-binding domain-containing protein [Pseudomonas lurida]